jgi:hypothetical protein
VAAPETRPTTSRRPAIIRVRLPPQRVALGPGLDGGGEVSVRDSLGGAGDLREARDRATERGGHLAELVLAAARKSHVGVALGELLGHVRHLAEQPQEPPHHEEERAADQEQRDRSVAVLP